MAKWQIALLGILAMGLLVLLVCTWGSVGSVVCGFCLIIMLSALLFRRFVLERDRDDFEMEM